MSVTFDNTGDVDGTVNNFALAIESPERTSPWVFFPVITLPPDNSTATPANPLTDLNFTPQVIQAHTTTTLNLGFESNTDQMPVLPGHYAAKLLVAVNSDELKTVNNTFSFTITQSEVDQYNFTKSVQVVTDNFNQMASDLQNKSFSDY